MTTIERDTKMLWQSFYEEGLHDFCLSESTAIAYANEKMADLEARAIDAAMDAVKEAEEVF